MADISSLISQPNNSGNESMAPNPIDTQQLQQQEQQASVKEEEEDADRDVSMLDGSNDKKGKKATDSLNGTVRFRHNGLNSVVWDLRRSRYEQWHRKRQSKTPSEGSQDFHRNPIVGPGRFHPRGRAFTLATCNNPPRWLKLSTALLKQYFELEFRFLNSPGLLDCLVYLHRSQRAATTSLSEHSSGLPSHQSSSTHFLKTPISLTTSTMDAKQPHSAVAKSSGLPRVRRACDECRRKKERCDPSHHKQPVSPSPKTPTQSSPARKKTTSSKAAPRAAHKAVVRLSRACDECRRKKARCNPSHHLPPSPPLNSVNSVPDPVSPIASASLQSLLAGRKAGARVIHHTPSPASLIVKFKYSPADLADYVKNAQPQALAGASRTASVAPPPAAAAATALPTEVPDNGDPIRVFINKRLSPHLMEGMKVVVRNRPEDPLRVLGTYLLTCADKYEPKPQDATNAGSAARVDDNNPTIANDDDDDEDMEE